MKNEKYNNLLGYLKKLESVVVAFSGGVDSTFLLKAAKEALEDKVVALTIVSPYIPDWEVKEAKELVKKLNVKHEFIKVPVIMDEIKYNPDNRCYLCKKNIFTKIKEFAKKNGYNYVIDGTNLDDTKDYRPGLVALKELEIKSPLLINKLTKNEIRELSKELGLNTWKKPSYACLLSRIPYGNEIKIEELKMIEKGEEYLISIGFNGIRVRAHNGLARIEVQNKDMERFLNKEIMISVSKKLKEYGFKYVTLDMEGYRTGSLNYDILKNS